MGEGDAGLQAALREIVDKAALRNIAERYAQGVDRRDRPSGEPITIFEHGSMAGGEITVGPPGGGETCRRCRLHR